MKISIIDAIIRATAEQVRARVITDPEEAALLGVRVGDTVQWRLSHVVRVTEQEPY